MYAVKVPGSSPAETVIAPADDLIALEENPPQLVTAEPAARRHGEWFTILRKGLERAPAAVRVIGLGERTLWPLVVDLDSVESIDSSGLTSLLDAQDRLRAEGGDLKIISSNHVNQKILQITRLDEPLEVFDSVIDAVKSFV